MRWQHCVARAVSTCVFWRAHLGCSRSGLRILLYHAVGSRLPRDPYGISVSIDLFERQMKLLAGRTGARVIELPRWQMSGDRLEVAVTFDDGYKDNLYAAAPILLKYRIPFTVFVTPAFIRSGAGEYLTAEELKELAALPGVTIGSHGETHVPLATCDDLTLDRELIASRQYLEDLLGMSMTMIAYPHGSVNQRVREAAARAGYTVGVCSRFDINGSDCDPLLLSRTEILGRDSLRIFRQKLNGSWDWLRWRKQAVAF